eukprot:CAMPEP_0172329052 /NCGR_PEP_ID=MMETSP1058-20130122/60671_1 /TAXON_ID=83371 /ORGANISM="Detonula confervacea, Strain CCMP 353" /LENGTH=4507 /DNA_ID=CAMNT_0013046199 /DNA_START=90 /DNA_END=13614 /DNA_ORIENTATION=-
MAPVTATSAGIARQTIDDPTLIALLQRLSKFDPSAISDDATGAERRVATSNDDDDDAMMVASDNHGGEDVTMMDAATDNHGEGLLLLPLNKPPLDVNGLVAELDGVPRWDFQEQADLYEWIHPLNAMDAALSHLMEIHPSLLLLREKDKQSSERTQNLCDDDSEPPIIHHPAVIPPAAIHAIQSILKFQSHLLRNATNKSIYNSIPQLSNLLTASNDDIASLAIETLSALATPPMLHRQQAPEMSQHTTALHRMGANSQVMWRLMGLARGWGTKGSGLGLLQCVTMDDGMIMLENDEGAIEESELRQEQSFYKCAGEISFECYCQPEEEIGHGGRVNGSLVSLYVSKEEMFHQPLSSPSSSPSSTSTATSPSKNEQQKEKRRKIVNDQHNDTPQIKSTFQIYRECLDKIKRQLHGKDPEKVLSSEKLFTLLSSIRLARSFHSSASRIAAVERRLRSLACVVHSHSGQECVSAYFFAQPELCGELVDLLRPTVSSGNISSGVVLAGDDALGGSSAGRSGAIVALSDSPLVPYAVRTLAIETLTALVARRDASTGTLTNVARQTNVLSELGVGKGNYLGILPTLIRYSLASLNSFLLHDGANIVSGNNGDGKENGKKSSGSVKDIGLELGLAFLKATKPPPLPQKDREERALEFIDSVLTLTSAVISVPSGTASLTDCGIIPALVSTIALDSQMAKKSQTEESSSPFCTSTSGKDEESYSDSLLKFISAQAIQILEGAIVTHNSALSAFHELKGVDILVQRLNVEVEKVKHQEAEPAADSVDGEAGKDAPAAAAAEKKPRRRNLQAARRVLLFSAVNCLTVVFHQHDSGGANPAAPSGGSQLRKPELQNILLEIMDNVDSYGGVLAALVATFLSDVMNSDPQVVHFVHKSGLAKSFLSILMEKDDETKTGVLGEPILEPSGELIMALPNVITALSLTEAGAKAVAEANPFPAILGIFCSPKYVMPNSRCLLNEMAAIIGTGLDEMMRHNPSLKTICLKAVVQVMNSVVDIGKNLISDEDGAAAAFSTENKNDATAANGRMKDLETARTYLMQYAYNITQILEQILHSEDHVAPFVAAGGFDSLLDMARWAVTPGGKQLVVHVTCLSSTSVASATHSTTSNTLSVLVKTVCSNTSDPSKLIKKIMAQLESQLLYHGNCVKAFTMDENRDALVCDNVLENVPPLALYSLEETNENLQLVHSLSCLFRSLIHVDWLTRSLATAIRAAYQRANELGVSIGREREWKKEIASKQFENIVNRLSLLHRSSLLEVCRIRTESGFDVRDEVRSRASDQPLMYKIRIVCQEGAIVRNGIDIDRCDNVGSLEMGEIVYAYDRCINSSGVLRYQTSRGWVSELTRGHARENITEILDVNVGSGASLVPVGAIDSVQSKRIECGVPDLRSAAASVLARLHGSQSNLFSSLEKMMVSGIRGPQRSLSSGVAPHVISAQNILSSNLKANFAYVSAKHDAETGDDMEDKADDEEASFVKEAKICMYFGTQLNILHSSLCEEKREEHRRIFNVPLLINLLVSDGWKDGVSADEQQLESPTHEGGVIISAIRFVLMHSLRDMALFAAKERALGAEQGNTLQEGVGMTQNNAQRMSRAVASSFPPTLSLLRRLMSRPLLFESQISIVLAKMKDTDFPSLITNLPQRADLDDTSTPKFNAAQFTRALHLKLAKVSYEVWSDDRFSCAPSHVMHPWIQYLGEVIRSLEEAGKVIEPSAPAASTRERLSLAGGLQDPNSRSGRILASMGMLRDPGADTREETSEPFVPSEESISRLAEMGFVRDHALEALESVRTNRVEVAMEYALMHPPSSPATLERRRAAREQRRLEQQRRNESERQSSTNEEHPIPGDTTSSNNTDGTQNQPPDAASPNNNEEEPKPKSLTKDELKAKREKEIEETSAAEVKEYLQETVKESLCKISLDIIEGTGSVAEENIENPIPGDSQGVIIVISNFLLDICALESNFALELLRRLKAKLDLKSPSQCQVKSGCEFSFAALVHASVIIFRALPKLRPLVLRQGFVGMITHCVRNCTLTSKDASMIWPRWLAPSLLILEVMAQPTSVTLDDEGGEEAGLSKPANKKSEYGKVLAEHKKQTCIMAKTTKNVFSTVMNKKEAGKMTPKKKDAETQKSDKKTSGTSSGEEGKQKDAETKRSDKKTSGTSSGEECKQKVKVQPPLPPEKDKKTSGTSSGEECKQKVKVQPPLPPIPAILPLLHSETQEACMMLCLQLLGLRSKKGVIDKVHVQNVCPPPLIVQAILALLVRVLRSRQLAFLCLQMGGADLILALPSCSYFTGNRDIIQTILRRMLEDEVTLHSMMEAEIRSVCARIYRKNHPSHTAAVQPKVNLKSFMQACAPLICRDPLVFLKAIASSVKIIGRPGSESSSLASSRGSQVTLLNSEERARNNKLLSSHFAKNSIDVSSTEKTASQEEQPRRASRGRGKSPHRASISKSPKSTTPMKNTPKNHCQLNGTPANHVTSLLLKEIMRDANFAESSSDKQPFLTTLDYLDTLSDLVLAVPACGAAIHRYKPAKDVIIHNSVSGCPDPPQTAVSYLLHKLLPQPRPAPKEELDSSIIPDIDKTLKLQAYNRTKTAQAAARLIVCLVARSGEGRRRVISDLVFALSCGQGSLEKESTNSQRDENAEMWAISAWGDLCMGLSAPRSSAGSLSGQDSNATLSFGVVKLMLQHGAAHALMTANERIGLHHPMASSVASSIIRPLEIFTRGSVYTTVSDMAEKDKAKLEAAKTSKESRRVTFGPSHRSESDIYDVALEDEFANNPSARRHFLDGSGILDESLDESMENSGDEDENESMEEDSDGSSEIEVRLGNVDYSDESNDDSDNSSDEEISSDGSSDGEDESDAESEGENMDDDDAEDDIFSDDSEEEEEEEVGDWGVDNEDDFFDGNVEDEVNNGGAAAGGNEVDDGMGMMEGWTAVNNGNPRGLGSMLLDMVAQPHGGGQQPRLANGGFSTLDAAEAMLGNILRGDMGLEANLTEIEDSLGIRVVRGDRGAGLPNRTNPNGTAGNNIGSGHPAVHQNNVYSTSTFGNRGLVEFSPMEFVFGAPATGAGSQVYDGTSSANEDAQGRPSESPSTYDTHLFPGGLAASTHSRTHPSIHPLLTPLRLPPVNSLVSTRDRDNTLQARNARTIESGSYVAGPNGHMIRVNDEGSDRRRTTPSALTGWVDDGLPPDRSTEEFSVSFGQALNSFLQDWADSQDQSAAQNNDNPPDEDIAPPEGQGESPIGDGEVGGAAVEELEAPTENNVDDADTMSNNEPPPSAQETQSEAAAEVSSAMAAGLTISQPASASDNAPTSPNSSILNDQPSSTQTNSEDIAEGTNDDAVMTEELPIGEDVEDNAEEQALEEGALPDNQPAESHESNQEEEQAPEEENAANDVRVNNDTAEVEESGQLTCPPDIDPEVFNSLPLEMQQEIVAEHEVAAQISESGLDPEALAALPEEMRREVIEQEQQRQRLREQEAAQPAADPANAEDMDNASFLASLAPDLRQEILLTADDAFISSLPSTLIAEANVLRERVASQHRRRAEETNATNAAGLMAGVRQGTVAGVRPAQPPPEGQTGAPRGRRQRNGKLRIESGRKEIVYAPGRSEDLGPLLTTESAKAFLSLLYLLSPVQPQRIVHKLMLNMCLCEKSRDFFLNVLVGLLNNEKKYVLGLLEKLDMEHKGHGVGTSDMALFPPSSLIGTTAEFVDRNPRHSIGTFRRRQGGNSAVSHCLPASVRGSGSSHDGSIPPVVARRIISLFSSLCKSSPRVAFSMLCNSDDSTSCLEKLLGLLEMNQYQSSASNLEQLLGLLEIVVAPMSLLPKDEQDVDLSADRSSPGREWVKVPRVVVSNRRLHLLINTLRLESCKDSSFLKVNTLTRRLSRVEANRECILDELALVAEGLGKAAILDLKAVSVRLSSAAKQHREKLQGNNVGEPMQVSGPLLDNDLVAGTPSSAVSLSTSNSELKLLRVLQMLNSLCAQDDEAKSEGNPPEFVSLLQSLNLESLWDQLSVCLKTVGVLEGVANIDVDEIDDGEEEESGNDDKVSGKKNLSGLTLISRFLPAIEAFFMVNASSPPEENEPGSAEGSVSVVDNSRVVQFAASNTILLNALLRSNPQLLDKGLRAMVKMPKCRLFLDFDVKRQWFKTQVRRLRQQASRRHGSFRLNLRRKHVFEDSFHAFIHRNADELRGRLQITFVNEEGVDAGGLSREFFAILAKEMFNPNYALFMSTEDGCTFQPNPNSSINPDDLRYFRFVGRIVGKAVVDGYLLDAHFTRSLYKHMLGVKPTHHDMQAIDPDYYKNLQMILEHNLKDIGLELTFSTEDHSFGRSRTIDLIPDGHKIPVTEETKERYVNLVCQHRITTAIEKQIKAYLEGFHEMVDPDLISIFSPTELELLISGMPEIDIHDLKKNTDYNGYRPADREICWFWNIMFALTRSEKAAFLQFVTGSSKVPLAGFSELQGMRGVQKFSIVRASGSAGALMSAHTCFNSLDLPVYKSEQEMKEKLLYAMSEGGGGFGFA